MNQRVKIKKLKHQVNTLDKALNETIKRNEKYEERLKCKVAAKNILINELEESNLLLLKQLENVRNNTEILCNSLSHKTEQVMDLQKQLAEINKENDRRKSFFERIFA